jgi:hypothetical protein
MQYVPPKSPWTCTRLHGVTSQKLVLLIVTAGRKTNPTRNSLFLRQPKCSWLRSQKLIVWNSTQERHFTLYVTGARGSVFGWGTMLQAGRSRVRFPIR